MIFPTRSWIASGALLIATVLVMRSIYVAPDSAPKPDGTQKGQRGVIHQIAPPEPRREQQSQGSHPGVAETVSSQAPHRIAEAVAAVTPRARSLLLEWEEKAFRPLEFANTVLRNEDHPAAALVIPPPDHEAEGALLDLVVGALVGASTGLEESVVKEVKDAIGWPEHSRLIIAQSVADAEDSVMVIENADEKNIAIDPVTGGFSFSSDTGFSLDALDLRNQNRYSHLFEVSGESDPEANEN